MKLTVFPGLLLLVFTISLLNACKKDQDTIPPVIVINSPAEGQTYHVFDTIPLNIKVSDNKQLGTIGINLLDAAGSDAMPAGTINPSGNPFQITGPYPLSEIHLATGPYTFKVTATDGHNITNAFIHLNIIGAPTQRKAIYLVSTTSNSVRIMKADTNFVITPFLNLNGDYAGSDISSYWQQLYVSGLYNGNFNAINLSTGVVAWSQSPVVGSNPWFEGAYVGGNQVYVPFYNGFVRAYDHVGNLYYVSQTQTNYHPRKMLLTGSYLLDEQIYITNTSSKLVVNSATTGAGIQEINLSQSLVKMISKDADNVFLFGNSGGQGMMQLYTISLNGLWSPHAIPAGSILDVSQVDPDTYLIALSDGNIYKYQYSVNSLTTYMSGINASNLIYDPLKNEVVLSSATRLSSYDYGSLALKHTALNTDTIRAFHILNNK